jgi:hypothetical protein
LSDHAEGAIAEAFGRFPEWMSAMLAGSPALPGSIRAIARYQLGDESPVCNLDDPRRLVALKLRPSQVVSRDYARTRTWALEIYRQAKWAGVRWWSYYDPRWSSFGLWDARSLKLEEVTALTLRYAPLLDASRAIARRVIE